MNKKITTSKKKYVKNLVISKVFRNFAALKLIKKRVRKGYAS